MDDEVTYWLCLPDGTIAWAPHEEDYELWRDEARDLTPDTEWD